MPRTIPRGWAVASVCLLALALSPDGRADEAAPAHRGTSKHDALTRRGTGVSASSNGYWLSTAGIALALAAFGAISLGARKIRPAGESGPLKVIGRTSLSPR